MDCDATSDHLCCGKVFIDSQCGASIRISSRRRFLYGQFRMSAESRCAFAQGPAERVILSGAKDLRHLRTLVLNSRRSFAPLRMTVPTTS
jgi:hypothetical protein